MSRDELSRHLGESLSRALDELDGNWVQLDPADGSPASLEREDNPLYAHAAWGERPVTAAHKHNVLMLVAAADHLRAIAVAVNGPAVTPYALHTLARGSPEASGRANWLWSGEGARERVARSIKDRICSLRKQNEAFHKAKGEKHPWSLDRAAAFNSAASSLRLKLPPRPGLEDSIVELLKAQSPKTASTLLYSMLSAVAHTERWGISSLLEVIPGAPPQGDEGQRFVAGVSQRPMHVALLIFYPLLGQQVTLERWTQLYGHSDALASYRATTTQLFADVREVVNQENQRHSR